MSTSSTPRPTAAREPRAIATKSVKPTTGGSARSEGLRSVSTAFEVLDCFAFDEELGVSDIARRLGIAKSTAHRLLTTMCIYGMIAQNPETGRYRLGLHLFELGQLAQQRLKIRQVALPLLEELRHVTGHTVHLGVVDRADIVYAERLDSPECARFMTGVPRRLPSHCTSSGKAIAAFNDELAARRRATGFPPRTVGTVRTLADYDRALEQTRRRGVAMSVDETVLGLTSVAAPVRDISGRAYAAVSIVAPTTAIATDIDRTARLVTTVAGRLSRQLALAG